MYINKISVNTNYRGLGIAQRLMDRTLSYMKEKQLEICQITCTNEYLLKVCLKINFKVMHELKFENYVVNGRKPIQPKGVNNRAIVLIKLLN